MLSGSAESCLRADEDSFFDLLGPYSLDSGAQSSRQL